MRSCFRFDEVAQRATEVSVGGADGVAESPVWNALGIAVTVCVMALLVGFVARLLNGGRKKEDRHGDRGTS